ncbi:hypothetical protein GCM10008908_24390 [Clostridium subterminale]|uniref:Phage protein n=1 Tax=Clostridium subterminale TaxID=1550 RepID=A0ABP3W486_CLOSU
MDKWTYTISENSDIWRGGVFDSKEEAIKEANSEAIEYNEETFRIGIVEEVFNYGIDVDQVIEHIQDTMYDEVGEVAEDYLDYIPSDYLIELEKQLNEVFYNWQEKYNYKPTFYKVISEEIVKVKR